MLQCFIGNRSFIVLYFTQPFLQRQCLSPNNLTLNQISVVMLKWYICGNTTDVAKNFAVIKRVSINSYQSIKMCTEKPQFSVLCFFRTVGLHSVSVAFLSQ